MKSVLSLLLFISLSFSFEIDIKNELYKCSEIKVHNSRLMCFDVLVLNITPKDEFLETGKIITRECSHCHGGRWEISTNGDRLVSDMNEEEIYQSLLKYKEKKIESTVMNFQMSKYSEEQIKDMAKFIKYEINNKLK